MSASREAFDIFNKYQRRNVWNHLRRGRGARVRIYIFRDTFTKWICKLSGGCEFYWQPDPVNEPEELFCNWCHTRKPTP